MHSTRCCAATFPEDSKSACARPAPSPWPGRPLVSASLRRGALDGETISVAAYATARLHASRYTRLLLWGAHAEVLVFAINRARWDTLSEPDRELVRQAARDAAEQAATLARRATEPSTLAE